MVKEITNKYGTLGQEVAQEVGSIRYKILVNHLSSSLQRDRLFSLKTKNKKLKELSIRWFSVVRIANFAGECFLVNLHLKRMKFRLFVKPYILFT